MMLSQLLALQLEMVRYELRQAMHAVSGARGEGSGLQARSAGAGGGRCCALVAHCSSLHLLGSC